VADEKPDPILVEQSLAAAMPKKQSWKAKIKPRYMEIRQSDRAQMEMLQEFKRSLNSLEGLSPEKLAKMSRSFRGSLNGSN
jgi:hypothetical protein